MAFTMTGTGPVNGYILYYYLADEVPNYAYGIMSVGSDPPKHVIANDVKQDPVFLSPNRTIAKQWRFWSGVSAPIAVPMSPAIGLEYVLLTTPAGAVYAYGLGDDGNFYTEPFESGAPYNRIVNMTVMHKRDLVWVADKRRPVPKPGDW
uniref:hypothetical protein n=1 Tax=Nitrospira sp. BLG_1 TaxID=3395883 RepID=UPI0039BC236E